MIRFSLPATGIVSFLLILGFLFCSALVHAQSSPGTVSGQIQSTDHQSVEFADIMLEGTSYHATSDAQGHFSLTSPAGSYTLHITHVGYVKFSKRIAIYVGKDTNVGVVKLSHRGEMKEVVVREKTETRKINESGFHVNAIDLKVQHNLTSDLNQVLNRTTGVRIREEGGLGSNFNFSLNGFSGNQVKFFLDGIPMDNFGSSLTLNNFPTNMAERIEVYKGVLPINLGTDALGGAINIVTRSNPNYLDASYSVGSFNTHRASVNAAYTNAPTGFTVRTNAFYNYSTNNYRVLVPIKDLTTSSFGAEQWRRRFHDGYESATMQVEAGVTGKKYADKLLLGLIASGNDRDIQTGVVMEKVFGAMTSRTRSLIPTLKYKKTDLLVEGLDLNLYSAYNSTNFRLTDTTAREFNWLGESKANASSSNSSVGGERTRTRNENKDREALVNTNLTYRLNALQTVALNYLYSNFHRSSYDPENPEALGNRFPSQLSKHVLGAAWNLTIANTLNTSVFGKFYTMQATGYKQYDAFTEKERYDVVTFRYSNPGYGMATAYFVNSRMQVKASYEHAYRLPESGEIFGDGVFVVYSVGLKPEKSDNVNLGARYATSTQKDHKFTAELGLIYRQSQDFIRLDQSIAGANRQYENKGNVRTMGVEAELTYAYKNIAYASVNGTFQDITDRQKWVQSTGLTGGTTPNFTYGFRLPNLPYLFGNFNAGVNLIRGENRSLSVNYTLNYVEKYYLVYAELGASSFNRNYIIPTQLAHNLSANYSLKNGRYNLAIECRNLTDNLLFDSYRLQKPGRSFSAKLRYFISK